MSSVRDGGRSAHERELCVILDEAQAVKNLGRVHERTRRRDPFAKTRPHHIRRAKDAIVERPISTESVVDREGVLQIVRQALVELLDRIRRVRPYRLHRAGYPRTISVPNLALAIALAAEDHETMLRMNRGQDGDALGLVEAGEVVEIAILSVGMVYVGVARIHARSRHDHHGAGAEGIENTLTSSAMGCAIHEP